MLGQLLFHPTSGCLDKRIAYLAWRLWFVSCVGLIAYVIADGGHAASLGILAIVAVAEPAIIYFGDDFAHADSQLFSIGIVCFATSQCIAAPVRIAQAHLSVMNGFILALGAGILTMGYYVFFQPELPLLLSAVAVVLFSPSLSTASSLALFGYTPSILCILILGNKPSFLLLVLRIVTFCLWMVLVRG
jgi:hypothetical protein